MLRKSIGNMYDFVTHTWNPIKGKCYHDCSYCYMKQFGEQKPIHIDEKELKTDLGENNFIFVGSSCDIFAQDIPDQWIEMVLNKIYQFKNNEYLIQSKNPERTIEYFGFDNADGICTDPNNIHFCTTIETNRYYDYIMGNSPEPCQRADGISKISKLGLRTYLTIEPIMDFDLDEMVELIEKCNPVEINIGADSKGNHLPEPNDAKIQKLVSKLIQKYKINLKHNLSRLVKE